jgi:hypothetical protein
MLLKRSCLSVPTYVECLFKDIRTHALKEELLVSAYVCRTYQHMLLKEFKEFKEAVGGFTKALLRLY